jgi:hypothetical protein
MEHWLCTERYDSYREELSPDETNIAAWSRPIILSTIEAHPPEQTLINLRPQKQV